MFAVALPDSLTPAGIAYRELEKWMVGATVTGPLTQNGTVWTLPFSRSGGYQALAVWNTGTTGYNGSSSYTVPSWATQYHDLAGNVTTGLGATVTIGMKPILLENQSAF